MDDDPLLLNLIAIQHQLEADEEADSLDRARLLAAILMSHRLQ